MFEKVDAAYAPYTYLLEKETFSKKVKRYFRDLTKHINRKFHLLKKALLQNLFKPNYLLQQQLPYDIRRAVSNLATSGMSSKASATEKKETYQLSMASLLPAKAFEDLVTFFQSRGWEVSVTLVTIRNRMFGKADFTFQQVDNISSISALEEGQEIMLSLSKIEEEK